MTKFFFVCVFSPFLSLRRTAWSPFRLSHIDVLCINLSYSPKDQSDSLSWPFWVFFFKIFFFASSSWKTVNIHRLARMDQNFDEYPGFQPKIAYSNMHTTVAAAMLMLLTFCRHTQNESEVRKRPTKTSLSSVLLDTLI